MIKLPTLSNLGSTRLQSTIALQEHEGKVRVQEVGKVREVGCKSGESW